MLPWLLFACAGADKPSDTAEPVDSGAPSDTATDGVGPFTAEQWDRIQRLMLTDPPEDPTNAYAEDPGAARLGQWLYFDKRLSANGEVGCVTCHDPSKGFADGKALAEGIGTTGRGSPTVLNTAWNRWFFWDGRADSHWAQALGPLESPIEHGFSRLELAHLLDDDPDLNEAYTAVFGALPDLSDAERFPAFGRPVAADEEDPAEVAWASMTAADQETVNRIFANAGKAIAAYERRVRSGPSDFDRYALALAAGDETGGGFLSDREVRGLSLFVGDAHCHLCHTGPTFSDLEFHNVGLAPRVGLNPDDLGRYDGIPKVISDPFNGLGAYSDSAEDAAEKLSYLALTSDQLAQFKTPPLRDVALTAPYMYGGQLATLEDVVRFYNAADETPQWGHREEVIVPLELDDASIADLVAFLEALTGDGVDAALTAPPDSPQ